jgi:dienelactone hydrolase
VILAGNLRIPEKVHGMVLLAHGSRNVENERYNDDFAPLFHASGLATLAVDLVKEEEDILDKETGYFRDNVSILSQRIVGIGNWLTENSETENYSIGYFGVGTVGAAVLMAAAERPDIVHALVSCGGRIEAAGPYLSGVQAATLFIAGEQDTQGIHLYEDALAQLATPLAADKKVETIAGVAQLLPDKLQDVAQLANVWFARHLVAII